MSYDARVFNVMIASPSDVASERLIASEVIYEWNAVHSEEKSMVLLPVKWESHTSPEIGDRAQAIINEQTVDRCDLLVGIFGTRLGTDTGEYPSGTIEEAETLIDLGKPVMLYFSNQLGDSGNFEAEQYTKLMQWKEHYKKRGLCESYDDDADFKDKFSRQLQLKVNQHGIFQFRGKGINTNLGREESESTLLQLSDEAKVLLKGVSQDNYGYISFEVSGYETVIRTSDSGVHGKNLIPDQHPRVVAQWKAALEELATAGLLDNTIDRKDGILRTTEFQITHRGYEVADMIEVTT